MLVGPIGLNTWVLASIRLQVRSDHTSQPPPLQGRFCTTKPGSAHNAVHGCGPRGKNEWTDPGVLCGGGDLRSQFYSTRSGRMLDWGGSGLSATVLHPSGLSGGGGEGSPGQRAESRVSEPGEHTLCLLGRFGAAQGQSFWGQVMSDPSPQSARARSAWGAGDFATVL